MSIISRWREKRRSNSTEAPAYVEEEEERRPSRWQLRHPNRLVMEFDIFGNEVAALRSRHRHTGIVGTKNSTYPRKRRKVTKHARYLAARG